MAVYDVLAFGDSLMGSSETSWTSYWIEMGCGVAATATQKAIQVYNSAYPGQQQSASWIAAHAALTGYVAPPGIKTTFALWKNWSPNDGGTSTAIQNDYNTYVAQFISLCQSVGVIPIMLTSSPSIVITDSGTDGTRLSCNSALLALGSSTVLTVDPDTALTNGASPARVQAQWSLDGQHYNDAGNRVVQALLATVLTNWINSH